MRRRKTVIEGLIARWHRTAPEAGNRAFRSVVTRLQTRGRMTGLRSGMTVCAGDEPR